jgi:hypothetical protein
VQTLAGRKLIPSDFYALMSRIADSSSTNARQLFICVHNEAFFVVAMRVSNPKESLADGQFQRAVAALDFRFRHWQKRVYIAYTLHREVL